MKILMTADTVGGVWTYAIDLARALAARGVRVALATMGAKIRPTQWGDVATVPGIEVFESEFRLEWMDDPWSDVDRAGEWLLQLERAVHPDIVHLNGYAHAALHWSAPVVVVGHSCVRSWWEAVRTEPIPPSWDRYTQRVRAGLAAADAVVAPSHAMLDALLRHYGPLDRARVIHNGRRAGAFAPVRKEPFVLAVGRLWDEAKNVGMLDDVAPLLTWPVYVAGDTRAPGGGERAFQSLHTLGALGEGALAGWMSRAGIYALPARYEPFGLSVLEAALSGCALVLGDVPSLREIWGDSATFVPADDAAAIARAINWLCDDDGLRRARGARARARARRLTPERMAREYDVLYRALREARATAGTMERLACAS